jgi:hypothetical protein
MRDFKENRGYETRRWKMVSEKAETKIACKPKLLMTKVSEAAFNFQNTKRC